MLPHVRILPTAGPAPAHYPQPLPPRRPALAGRSCHDANEVARAVAEGCDYGTVSRLHQTSSKPGYGPGPDAASCGPTGPTTAIADLLAVLRDPVT
jgi:hypothetical protein